MSLVIEDKDLEAAQISAQELRIEIAILLYKMRRFSIGRASKFANLHQIEFQQELAQRQIPINYDVEDFEEDMKTLGFNSN